VRTVRSPLTVVALALVLAGCSTAVSGTGTAGSVTAAPTITAGPPGSGITAEASSTGFAVQGRDLRLVRVGAAEVALQFEFFNGTDAQITPDKLGIDQVELSLMLVDLPRSTAYRVLDTDGPGGRLSESNGDTVPPGGSTTVTAMFAAPPEEATSMEVIIDGLQPVQVPVQPAGSPALVDDAVLRTPGRGGPAPEPVTCALVGPEGADGTKKTVIRLPSDVLFAFGSAELTPAARVAIEAVDDDIGSGGTGTVTIEGHTDAIGSDPDNQDLSERRAAAVRGALKPVLGSSYQYESVGFGETKPVAPNTKPDGSDDPDGRALNRRVEIRTGSVETVPATLEPLPPATDLSDAGLVAEVAGLERRGGFLLVRVTVRNPTGDTVPLGRGSGLTPNQADPDGLTLADRTGQLRQKPCHLPGRDFLLYYLANPSNEFAVEDTGIVPAGAEVTFWAFYAPPAAGVSSVAIEIGGFGKTVPTPVPS
jgi:outer membrane protein OmpA-like peptidoglycan-associated protein